VGVALGFVSLLLGLVFVVVAVTKIESGTWIGYLAIIVYGFGATGCALASRRRLRPDTHSRVLTRPAIGATLGLAAFALAVFAVRSAAFAASSGRSRTGGARPAELVAGLLDGLGAVGCFAAARQCFVGDHRDDAGVARPGVQ
jgi:hypothetical protein